MEILLNEKYSVNLEKEGNKNIVTIFENKESSYTKNHSINKIIVSIQIEGLKVSYEYFSKEYDRLITVNINLKKEIEVLNIVLAILDRIEGDL